MAKQLKPKVWWCVKSAEGRLVPDYGVYSTSNEAVRRLEKLSGDIWLNLHKRGWSVVKIEAREVAP